MRRENFKKKKNALAEEQFKKKKRAFKTPKKKGKKQPLWTLVKRPHCARDCRLRVERTPAHSRSARAILKFEVGK